MSLMRRNIMPLRTSEDILLLRQLVRSWMVEQLFTLVEQTKMVTATSELARNAVVHGAGGAAHLELFADQSRLAIQLMVEDHGPGIANIDQALENGFTTGNGLGLGLGGSKRLVHEFDIQSELGKGTRVTITMWKIIHDLSSTASHPGFKSPRRG